MNIECLSTLSHTFLVTYKCFHYFTLIICSFYIYHLTIYFWTGTGKIDNRMMSSEMCHFVLLQVNRAHYIFIVTVSEEATFLKAFRHITDQYLCNDRAESFAERDNEARSEAEGRTRARMGTLPRCDLVREIAVLNKNKVGRRARSD